MPDFDIVFQVTERTEDQNGQTLLVSEIEVETWWTNLYESADVCIRLYHDHGTSEQYHSELKSDRGVERLPSGKFKVNKLFLVLSMMAFKRAQAHHRTKSTGEGVPVVSENQRQAEAFAESHQ